MFEGLDFNKLMQQAAELQKQMQQKQEASKNKFHTISIGGGMVELEISEAIELKKVKIDPELLKTEEQSTLEELLLLGFNQAIKIVKKNTTPNVNDIMSQLQNNFPSK